MALYFVFAIMQPIYRKLLRVWYTFVGMCLQVNKLQLLFLDSSIPIEIQTMGENGLRYRSSLWEESMDWSYLKPYPVGELVDAAGAGDWCTAGIIHVLGQNSINSISRKRLETALNLGQCLAAINCHFEGARGSMYSISKHSLFSLIHTLMHRKFNEIETTKEILGSIRTASPENSTMQRICLCK
jgi:hypothetical protein